jgi:sugar phosphate isomerase/epimerase
LQTNYKPFIQVAIYSFIFYNAAMNTISFNTANFVAQQVGYNMTLGWGQGDQSNNDYCRPIDTFHDRFETMLSSVTSMGFDTIDLWTGILNYNWAEQRHIDIASNLFQKHKIAVISYAGGFGNNPDEFAKACHLCKSLNIPILGGGTPLISSDRIFHVHLKDVKARRATPSGYQMIDMGHETCALGDGVVGIKQCILSLKQIGYEGGLSIEHEPEDFDPTEDCIESKKRVEEWLAA